MKVSKTNLKKVLVSSSADGFCGVNLRCRN